VTPRSHTALSELLEACRPQPPAHPNILKTLLTIQEALGHVPVEAVPRIAGALGVTDADVAGVLSYYPDLQTAVRGRHTVRLCLGEACVANRSADLLAEVRRELNIGLGETSPDGHVTLERVYCLGNCGVGPTVMVDETMYGRVSAAELRSILKQVQAEAKAE